MTWPTWSSTTLTLPGAQEATQTPLGARGYFNPAEGTRSRRLSKYPSQNTRIQNCRLSPKKRFLSAKFSFLAFFLSLVGFVFSFFQILKVDFGRIQSIRPKFIEFDHKWNWIWPNWTIFRRTVDQIHIYSVCTQQHEILGSKNVVLGQKLSSMTM
jgi:hypothetical protein